MATISAGDFRNGVTIEFEGNIYQIIEFQHVKPGKGAAFVRTKLKNIVNGGVVEKTFRPTEKCETAHIDRKNMQYLYADGDLYYFMDNETYDQISIPKDRLTWEMQFLKPNDNVNIMMYNGEVLGVILPDKVNLEIVECEQAVKGDTATAALKNATLETGLTIKVPLFIQNHEMVIISTADGRYCGRAESKSRG